MNPQASQFLFQESDKRRYVALVGFQVANCGYLPEDDMLEVAAVCTHNDQPRRVFLEISKALFEKLDLIDIKSLNRSGPHLFNSADPVRLNPVFGRVKFYKRENMAVVIVKKVGGYEETGMSGVLVAQFNPSLGEHTLYTSSQDVQMYGAGFRLAGFSS